MEDDIVRYLGQLYWQMLSRRRNEDYEINPVQMDRFLALLQFLKDRVDPEFDEGIESFHLEAKEIHGGFSVQFCVFDLHGDEIPVFAQLLSCCSALSIDATSDSQICISVTIPDVFTLREGAEEV